LSSSYFNAAGKFSQTKENCPASLPPKQCSTFS